MTLLSTSDGRWGVLKGNSLSVRGRGVTFTDIAESKDGKLFANTFSELYKLKRSGQSKLVGSLGLFGINALEFDSKGRLFGAAQSGGFYRINQRTGEATLISQSSNFTSTGDLAYDASQNRFFATSREFGASSDSLFSISTKGKFTLVGDIGFSNVFGLTLNGDNLLGYTAQNQEIVVNQRNGSGTFKRNIKAGSGAIYGAT